MLDRSHSGRDPETIPNQLIAVAGLKSCSRLSLCGNLPSRSRLPQVTGVEMHQLATLQIHRHEIVWRFGRRAVGGRMILDSQLRRGDHDSQITIVLVVIVLEYELVGATLPRLDDLRRA